MSFLMSRRSHAAPRWILRLLWLVSRRPHFRPIWKADLVSKDLLGQAEFLNDAGYQIAACMLTRSFLERSLKRLALITPTWKECRAKSAKEFIGFLRNHGAIDQKTANLANSIYARSSEVCHCGGVTRKRTHVLLAETKSLRRQLEQATVVALGRAE